MSTSNNKKSKIKLTRSLRAGGYSVASAVIVLVIAIVANVLVGALPANVTKLDMTANSLYSLSEQTKTVMKNMDENVTIYWLVSAGQEDSSIEGMLDQYTALNSKLKVVKKDPDISPTLLEKYGVSAAELNTLIVANDNDNRYRYLELLDLFGAVADSTVEAGYTWTFNGEDAVTSAIDYCVTEDLPTVYTLNDHGESDLTANYADAVEMDNIVLKDLSLRNVEYIPDDADAVLICNPTGDISNADKTKLENYLRNGGNMLLITSQSSKGALTNLESLMSYYGMKANPGIIVEGTQKYYTWGDPTYLMPYQIYHATTNPLKENNYKVLLPMAQGLTIDNTLRETLTVQEVLSTSSASYSKVDGAAMTTYDKEEGDIDGPFAVAAAAVDELDDGLQSNVMWVSSRYLVDDSVNSDSSGANLSYFLNALNWTCGQGEDTMTISAKSLAEQYLTMNSSTSTALIVIFVALIPLCYLVAGIVVLIRRKRK